MARDQNSQTTKEGSEETPLISAAKQLEIAYANERLAFHEYNKAKTLVDEILAKLTLARAEVADANRKMDVAKQLAATTK